MNNKQKKALYESIMKNVARQVKKALNEDAAPIERDFERWCESRLDEIIANGSCQKLTPDEKRQFAEYVLANVDWATEDDFAYDRGERFTDDMADDLSYSRGTACSDFAQFLEDYYTENYGKDGDFVSEWDEAIYDNANPYDNDYCGLYLLRCVYDGAVADGPLYDFGDSIIAEIEYDADRY